MAEESLCLQCGNCCKQKLRFPDGTIAYSPFRCKFQRLDGSCGVYATRFRSNPRCLTIEEAIAANCLPRECPYVRGIPNYWGPRDHPELWRNKPENVMRAAQLAEATPEDLEAALRIYCPDWKRIPKRGEK